MRPLISRLFVTFYVMMMLTVTNASFVIGNGSRTATVACQSEVKKVCSVPVNTIFVDWAIDYTDDPQTLVASCSRSSGCNTFHNFSSRYSFSYDSTKGISNLTINPVLREDDNRKYKCSDGSTEPMTLYVQVLPERNGTQVTSHRKQNEVVLKANTSCVYPVATVNMTWLYRTKNGSRFVDQNGAVPVILSCQSSSDGCVNSTNDKMLNSFLNFSTAENGEWREYSLEISYLPVSKNDIGVYEVTVGQFNVTNIESVTTSTTINTSTATTSTPSTNKTANSGQKQSFFEKNKIQSIIVGLSICVFLVILIVIVCVCCKLRKKRQNEK